MDIGRSHWNNGVSGTNLVSISTMVLYVWVPQNSIFYIRQILLGSRAILGSSCELSPEPVSELQGDK